MMPTSSISAALAWPTAYATAQRVMRGTIRSLACGASSLESRTPTGAERQRLVDDDDTDGDRPGEGAPADLVHTGEDAVPVALERALHAQAGRRDGQGVELAPAAGAGTPAKSPGWSDSQVGAAQGPHEWRRPGR